MSAGCLDGEATNGGRPPRRQGLAASKQDTSSNTMNTALAATAVDRGSVYFLMLGEWESAAVRPAKQHGRGH